MIAPELVNAITFSLLMLILAMMLLMRTMENRRRIEHPTERDANEALIQLRALGCTDERIRDRLAQAVALEVASDSREYVLTMLRFADTTSLSRDDLAKVGLARIEPW